MKTTEEIIEHIKGLIKEQEEIIHILDDGTIPNTVKQFEDKIKQLKAILKWIKEESNENNN